jgi:hypothetical protein
MSIFAVARLFNYRRQDKRFGADRNTFAADGRNPMMPGHTPTPSSAAGRQPPWKAGRLTQAEAARRPRKNNGM